ATRCPWWIGSNVPPMIPTRRGSGRLVRTTGARVFFAGARTALGVALTAADFAGAVLVAALTGAAFTAALAAFAGSAFAGSAFAGSALAAGWAARVWALRAGIGTTTDEGTGHQSPPQVVRRVDHGPAQGRRDVLAGEQLLGPLHSGGFHREPR